MDFFDREARAQKQTRRLVWLFGLAVLALLIVNNLLLASLYSTIARPMFANAPSWHPLSIIASALYLFGEALVYPRHFLQLIWNPQVFAIISFSTLLSVSAGCYYKTRQLAAGGTVVAEFLGGRRIPADTADPDEQRLRNVIEEMAIASGTSVPEVYLLDNERGINTFAAGHTRDDVAIGVTRGAVQLLTRDELSGVIAHEFSHILNGDTRLNMQLIGLAHGLFWPTLLGRLLIYGSLEPPPAGESCLIEGDQPKVLPTAPLGCLFVVLGCLSLPSVRFFKSAICRQREWLADAAAVQFTRYPAGLTGALKKIGGLFKHGRLDTPHAEVASHLYFVDSRYEPWFSFLATHPPLRKRIAAIEPAFDGQFPRVQMLAPNQFERNQAFDQTLSNLVLASQTPPNLPQLLDSQATSEHLRLVALMRAGLPPEVKNALRTPVGAMGVIFSLLLGNDDSVCAAQTEILRRNLAPEMFATVAALAPQIDTLGDRYKLTLAELAVPALRQNTPDLNRTFNQVMQQLIECEGSIDLFEYTLMKMVARQLRAHFSGPDLGPIRGGRVQDLLPECALILSAVAHVGADNPTEAQAAFANGADYLDSRNVKPEFVPRSGWDLSKVDAALTKLAGYHQPLKLNVLLACGRTATANGSVNDREAELLRAIADSFDCSIPPFVEAMRSEELASSP
ncbi:MAG: M48 family metalloprotease [Verrucomicrobiae bacterium]|nr:M48 family metalloprotease [Verrucomicrobiae bacterium]